MTHVVYRIEVTYRSSEKPHIFEYRTEDEQNERYQELVYSSRNDPNGFDIVGMNRTVAERDNNPKGVTKDIAFIAVIITRKLFVSIANKTMLSMEQVADKVAVLALQTSNMITAQQLELSEDNIITQAKRVLFVSHNIHID